MLFALALGMQLLAGTTGSLGGPVVPVAPGSLGAISIGGFT